jgi:hypothetical protein
MTSIKEKTMKIIICKSVAILTFIMITQTMLFAGGSEVTVWLKNGARYEAELLAVRDSSILLSMLKHADDAMLLKNPSVVSVIKIDSIIRVMEEGHSYLLVGMGLGLVTGTVVGGVVGASESKSNDPIVNAFTQPIGTAADILIGGLIGLGAGALVGGAASSSDQVYLINSPSGRAALRLSSRYPEGEPDFIKVLK